METNSVKDRRRVRPLCYQPHKPQHGERRGRRGVTPPSGFPEKRPHFGPHAGLGRCKNSKWAPSRSPWGPESAASWRSIRSWAVAALHIARSGFGAEDDRHGI